MGIVSINDINSKIACTKLYASQFPSYAQIYAKNKIGLKQLYKLVSIGSTEQLYGELTIFDSQINENRNDLIIANNPYEGDIWDIACNGTREELEKAMEFYDYIFIAPVESIAHDVARNVINKENAQSIVRDIVSCAYAMGKPVCAVSGFFYLDK
jgi:DNA polymerase-3 subunit alpha (Gram-positive type)